MQWKDIINKGNIWVEHAKVKLEHQHNAIVNKEAQLSATNYDMGDTR